MYSDVVKPVYIECWPATYFLNIILRKWILRQDRQMLCYTAAWQVLYGVYSHRNVWTYKQRFGNNIFTGTLIKKIEKRKYL
jgi:hypothetical protein